MKTHFILLLSMCVVFKAAAQGPDRITSLEERMARLEERVGRLESQVQNNANNTITPAVKRMQEAALARDAEDHKRYKLEDIKNAEDLYQRAARNLSSYEAKKLLDRVVTEYPQLNRAGCAQLYRAQQEDEGAEKERLLKDCIKRFGNCYYFDGVQVGPYAMYQLGILYQRDGKNEEANKLFRQIRDKYTDAVNHSGALLVSQI